MEQEPKQKPKFEVTPADDITNPPQHPIPPTEMILAQARVIKCRRELAKNIKQDADPDNWIDVPVAASKAELELALADLEEMNLHQMKWNLIQQIRHQLIQPATGMPPPGFKVPS